MKLNFFSFDNNRKLENAISFSIILFLFRLVFPDDMGFSPIMVVINEALVVLTFYVITLYVTEFIEEKKYPPLSLILNAGILNAFIFFVLAVIAALFAGIFSESNYANFFYSIASILYSLIFIAALSYIFSVFKRLFFLKQKKGNILYFNSMIGFLLATSASATLNFLTPSFDFINNAFKVVTILLIILNSIRISWIAFLTKKEKIYLLVISIILSILFGVNAGLSSNPSLTNKTLTEFSPALHQFLEMMMIYGSIFFGIVFFTTLFHLPTAEAFDRKAMEVSSLMDLSRLITQVFDFKELADTVTDITIQVCKSDSAWLVSNSKGELSLSAVRNIGYLEADKITNALTDQFDLKNINTVKTISKKQASLNGNGGFPSNDFSSFAVSPLKVHNFINGYLIAARRNEDLFDDDDQKAIGAFADYAAVAIENAKLLEESLEKERLEKELDVAREIQYKILPHKTPDIKGLEISALFIPAFEVGGDYYDFFRLEENLLGFVIADVSGKGISAAFIMAEVKGIFESLAKLILSPREVLTKANEILRGSLDKKSFVTVIYGIIDTKNEVMYTSRAGHSPLLLVRDGQIEEIKPSGMGLGLDFSPNFLNSLEEVRIKLKESDILVLFTDGIPEAKNASLEDYGYERFERTILHSCKGDINELSNQIMKDVTTYSQGNPQHDDITLVIFKWTKEKNNKAGEI
ncbi:MAG: SpoIIE family protein phosphatase [Bacteroidota bacterium]|nr:SpoIIE family protein phosphatase [Bacteroidota bacterium]